MHVFSVLSLFALSVYIYIGLYTYKLEVKKEIKQLILYLCASLSIWSFSYSFVYVSSNDSYFWIKLSAVGWCTFSAIVLHMVLVFTENRIVEKLHVRLLIYTPAAVFLFTSVFLFRPGYVTPKPISDFFYVGDFLYDFCYLLFSLILIYQWGKHSNSLRNKKQAHIILAAGAVPFALNLLTQNILPALGFNPLPNMGQIYALSVLLGMYYAIVKYKLFVLTPDMVINEILSEMVDLIFLLSPEGKILKVNEQTVKLLGYSQIELLDKPLSVIIREKYAVNALLESSLKFEQSKHDQLHCIRKNSELLPVSFSCSPVIDHRFSELLGTVIVGQDITVTKKLEKEIMQHREDQERIRESEERFRGMFYKHTAIMLLIDPETGMVFSANEAAQRFYGYSAEAFQETNISDINSALIGKLDEAVSNIIDLKCNNYYSRHRLANGEMRDVEIHASLIPFGRKKMIFSVIHDITERKKAEDHILYLAYHDSLTGLANRKHFYERLSQELERAKRKSEVFGVLYIDLDDFKMVNDTYGHITGDHLLCEVGKRIKSCIRESDLISRVGGDEFVLLILDILSQQDAQSVADKITEALKYPIVKDGIEFIIGASVGISVYPEDGECLNSLINKSDDEMYLKKKMKKGTGSCLVS